MGGGVLALPPHLEVVVMFIILAVLLAIGIPDSVPRWLNVGMLILVVMFCVRFVRIRR